MLNTVLSMSSSMVKEKMVTFDSGDLRLEGVLTPLEEQASPVGLGVVVCHPHPLYGGTMENMVVWGICDALKQEGVISLRFNFRGVGNSGGIHDDGEGEVDDVSSAFRYLKEDVGVPKVRLAGYSFGATMALKAALLMPNVDKIALVAVPGLYFEQVDLTMRDDLEVLLIGGSNDDVATPDALERYAEGLTKRAKIEIIDGANHFFGGKTKAVGGRVARFLSE
jgi:alpha/beta superfamily hydrolase